jgi:hypothetical protein
MFIVRYVLVTLFHLTVKWRMMRRPLATPATPATSSWHLGATLCNSRRYDTTEAFGTQQSPSLEYFYYRTSILPPWWKETSCH